MRGLSEKLGGATSGINKLATALALVIVAGCTGTKKNVESALGGDPIEEVAKFPASGTTGGEGTEAGGEADGALEVPATEESIDEGGVDGEAPALTEDEKSGLPVGFDPVSRSFVREQN